MHPLKKNLANKDLFKNIANKYGTPCYLYDKDRLVHNLNNLENALKENFEKYHICYSAKANNNPHLLKLMIDTLPKRGLIVQVQEKYSYPIKLAFQGQGFYTQEIMN